MKAKRAKTCRHAMASDYDVDGTRVSRAKAIYRQCQPAYGGCGEYIPWGPANDGSLMPDAEGDREIWFAILPEVRAAELAALMDEHIFFSMVTKHEAEHRGWNCASGQCAGDEYPAPDGVDEESGWLSYLIVHHGILIAAASDEDA